MLPRFRKLSRTYRHVGRYRQIVTVLVRYGFGQAMEDLKVRRYLRLGRGRLRAPSEGVEGRDLAVRIRLALEELGPTFIKLGQLLSTRPDLVPVRIAQELEKLQDQAPPFPAEAARRIIEQELRRPLEEVFSEFDPRPVAAASLGQVHAAVLAGTGEPVVVKVIRPEIHQSVATDLEILHDLAALAERQLEDLEFQRPTAIVEEFARALEKELDYTIEGAHLVRFARMFESDETVRIPRVHLRWTTRGVLTMERLPGTRLASREKLVQQGHDPQVLAANGVSALLRQIFIHGFFHSDPHPGNLLALPGDAVGFLDLGQIGRLDRRTRYLAAQMLRAMVERDEEGVTEAFVDLTRSETMPDRHRLETDIAELLDWHMDRPLGDFQIGRMVWRLMDIAARHHRELPVDLFLVFKSISTLESLARTLDPDFDLATPARPILERLARERLSPGRLASETWTSGTDVARLVRDLPGELRQILDKLRTGHLRVEFEHKGLDPALRTHELTTNRLVFAVVLGSLLVASSLVALGEVPPLWHGMPVIGLVGYLLSGVLGLALLWSIVRRGRL